jgi:hypothetical protein
MLKLGLTTALVCILAASASSLAASELRLDDFRGVQRAGGAWRDEPRTSIGFWLNGLYTRYAVEPQAAVGSFGFELSFRAHRHVGFYGGTALHWGEYYEDEGRRYWPLFSGASATAGARFYLGEGWNTATYVDVGGVFAGFHGSRETRETYSAGGETMLGFEFGGFHLRGFVATGITLLVPLNRARAGWLKTSEDHGALGVHFTFLRAGIRVRF